MQIISVQSSSSFVSACVHRYVCVGEGGGGESGGWGWNFVPVRVCVLVCVFASLDLHARERMPLFNCFHLFISFYLLYLILF